MTRTLADLPGPSRLPLLGNLHQVRQATLHATAEEWCERYGPIFRVGLGPRPVVVIDDLDEINRILRERPDGFRRWREIQTIFAEMGIAGVFSEEGEGWRRGRRLTVTALNSNHLQRYFHVVTTATERLYRRLTLAAREGRSIDITGELTSLTVDVTSALAFGHDLNTLEGGEVELQLHIQRVFEMLGRRLVMPVPYWRYVRLPADRALDRSLVHLHEAVRRFIEQARQRMTDRPELREAPENFLEGMLAAQEAEGKFTDEEIIGNVFTLLLAGEGPRFCPGRNLAFLESKTTMAMIARNFHIELDQSAGPVTEHNTFTMIPKGLRVRLRERAREQRPALV
jgi:cytochrome P450